MLAVNLEPFAAGRQQGDLAGLFQQPVSEDGNSLRDMFTVVQDQQQLPAGELSHELIVEALERPLAEPGSRRQSEQDGVRFARRSEITAAW
jgi:hypothetical protein